MAAKNKVLAVIPARLASQRLPGKPLKEIAGKTLVQRVWERGKLATSISRLVVSTDSEEIASVARGFGAEVVLTDSKITTGSERVFRTLEIINHSEWDAVVNLQGDMPFIEPLLIDSCIGFLLNNKTQFSMATVATPILNQETFLSPSDVKVVVSQNHQALYFSRAPIPHSRDGQKLRYVSQAGAMYETYGFKHFGLYVFTPEILTEYQSGIGSPLEDVEKLEQLRLLERGYRIGVCVVDPEMTAGSIEVDTPEDLARSEAIARKSF